MFKTIVVPLDGTPQSNVALPLARLLAHASRGRLVLVRVVDSVTLSPDERVEQQCLALKQLKLIANELHPAGIDAEVRVSTGDAASEILAVAEVEHADALIVATHTTGLDRLVDNSTTGRLVARSNLPVFVVRPGGRRVTGLRTVLAAVDGSPGGAQALDEAVALARLTGAALVLVRVIPAPEHFGFDPVLEKTLGVTPRPHADARALEIAEDYVNDVSRRLRAHGIEATPRVMVGVPAERIVVAAQQVDADLIVMSTHGYQVPLRTLLGSVADEVVRHAGRPVLLVRRTDVRGRPAGANVNVGVSRTWLP
jgi:nucleotide-binding universal stress UspA family protein